MIRQYLGMGIANQGSEHFKLLETPSPLNEPPTLLQIGIIYREAAFVWKYKLRLSRGGDTFIALHFGLNITELFVCKMAISPACRVVYVANQKVYMVFNKKHTGHLLILKLGLVPQ